MDHYTASKRGLKGVKASDDGFAERRRGANCGCPTVKFSGCFRATIRRSRLSGDCSKALSAVLNNFDLVLLIRHKA